MSLLITFVHLSGAFLHTKCSLLAASVTEFEKVLFWGVNHLLQRATFKVSSHTH